MDKLEDKFVTDEWVPPGITPATPTTKKNKKIGNVKRIKRTMKQKSQQ